MRDARIVFVEGMPGAGKSTVAQFITLQLLANDRPSRWLHEERLAHPVRLFYAPERHASASDYSAEAASRWQSYAGELLRQDWTVVLDGAIFQNHVRSMLLFGCEQQAILDLCSQIERLLAALNPVLIYLKPRDVEETFQKLRQVRGESLLEQWIATHDQFPYARRNQVAGHPGLIAFWKKFGELSDRVFERLTIPRQRCDVLTSDRGDLNRRVLNFLDLPLAVEVLARPDLDHFTGIYARPDRDTETEFVLKIMEGRLVACCDRPTLDVHRGPIGCFREMVLLPKSKNRFYVEAWPHEVQFVEDERGTRVSMQVSVDEEGWGQSTAVYERRQ